MSILGVIASIAFFFFVETFVGELIISFVPYMALWYLWCVLLLISCSRKPWWIAIALIYVCLSGRYATQRRWWYQTPTQQSLPDNAVSFFFANIYKNNTDYDDIMTVWQEQDPDIVILVEYEPHHAQWLAEMVKQYPYSSLAGSQIQRGTIIMSRYPLTNLDLQQQGERRFGAVVIELPDRPLYVFGVHTSAPVRPHRWRQRNDQLTRLAGFLDDYDTNTFVVGDFNISPWTPLYDDFVDKVTLTNRSRQTSIRDATWCFANITVACSHIDHIFASDDVSVVFDDRDLLWSDHDAFVWYIW